jgi:hypothetical protein
MTGWIETSSEGIATLYLSAVDEGMITSPTDTPANVQFRPRILNPEQFSIKREPPVWPQASTQGVQMAAYGQLEIDNYDGQFDFLISADLRDTTVIFKLPPAGALLTGTTMSSAPTIATALIDTVSCSNEDVITVSLKDTLARLDKTLPCRYNPPFVDSNAAGKMVQISLGPFRNRKLMTYDTPNRIFQIGDAPITNVTLVTDMAAPLDPSVPQYWPALSQTGLQLKTMPVGVLTCEGDSVGGQINIPGALDVLGGSGAFPGSNVGTTIAGSWLGQAGYGTTSTAVPTGAGPYTVAVTNTGAIPAVGKQVYLSDGTNKLLGTVTAGSTTTSIIITHQDHVGTVTSIASSSPLVQTGAPTGWKFTPGVLGTLGVDELIAERTGATYNGLFGGTNGARVYTASVWYPGLVGPAYGAQLSFETAVLQPGSSYRLTFGLYNCQGCGSPDIVGDWLYGVLVSTALSTSPADYLVGYANPLRVNGFATGRFAFEFSVPAGGSARKLYFMVTATAHDPRATRQRTTAT